MMVVVVDSPGRILEAVLGRVHVRVHLGQVLHLLQLLELLMVADVCVVGRQAHQIVDLAKHNTRL